MTDEETLHETLDRDDVIQPELDDLELIKNDPVPQEYWEQEELPKMGITATLTDGTGISAITGSKILKDFVADALMGAGAALVAVGVTGVDQAIAAPAVAITAVAGALISAGYRLVLRWATSE